MAITLAPLVVFKLAAAFHVYVVAPLATKLLELPKHTPDTLGVITIVGLETTVTVVVVKAVQVPIAPISV